MRIIDSHLNRQILFGILTFCCFLLMTGAAQETNTPKAYPPPGKLVDVGGWRLHLNCAGKSKGKTPTVILEAGSGDFSVDWSLTQPAIARFARVCSYDRAGAGWSELGPRPRTMRQAVYELHTALRKAGEKGPYVLAGHSLGGLLVRVYAGEYPKEVAGMVLVDSTHEDTSLMMNGKFQRMRELSQGRPIPPIRTSISAAEKELSEEEKREIDDFLKQMGPPKISAPYNRLPAEIQAARLWALSQPRHYAADNAPYLSEELAEIYADRQKQEYPLGATPLVALLAKPAAGDPPPGVAADEWRRVNEEKRRQKEEFATLSRNSTLIVAENSGHHIHLDEPEVVINAIRQVIEAVRRSAKPLP
jgi:pimeloyl-ACP methyl ester carboxylesterase